MSQSLRQRPLSWLVVGVVVAGLAVVTAVLAARSGPSAGNHGHGDAMVHIHGLGLNPADGRLYAATHYGVFVLDDAGDAARVGTGTQDTMGFTVVGPDHFLASGHPDFSVPEAAGRSPLLGLIESRDAGRTWTTLSLEGEADFHGLVATHDRIYGWNASDGRFMVSPDGRDWETRSELMLVSFAVDPDGPERIVASGQQGLVLSSDGGRAWQPAPGPALAFLSWAGEQLWAAGLDGRLHVSADGGATWDPREPLPAGAAALLAADDAIYAATQDNEVLRSADDGRSWTALHG